MNEEHTWTGNSEVDAAIIMLDRIDCSPEDDSRVDEVEATLRRLHARVQELEAHITKLTTWKNEGELEIRAWDTMKEQERKIIELEKMLEAGGAGGVSAQRVTQAADHIEQDRKMEAPVVLPEPGINTASHAGFRVIGYTEQQVRALLAQAPQQKRGNE